MSSENNIPQDLTPHDLIPKPCHKDWQKMTGDDKRRHCAQCNTHVEDLTGKSVDEILTLREKNGGKLCGAFRLAPSISRPLALGSGIASLALASCKTEEKPPVPVMGKICPPPEQTEPAKKGTGKNKSRGPDEEPTTKAAVEPKPAEVKHPDILLGDICIPEPPQSGKGPF